MKVPRACPAQPNSSPNTANPARWSFRIGLSFRRRKRTSEGEPAPFPVFWLKLSCYLLGRFVNTDGPQVCAPECPTVRGLSGGQLPSCDLALGHQPGTAAVLRRGGRLPEGRFLSRPGPRRSPSHKERGKVRPR